MKRRYINGLCLLVPSENKRDQRTIEQVMADSRARKRQKLDDATEPSSSTAGEEQLASSLTASEEPASSSAASEQPE